MRKTYIIPLLAGLLLFTCNPDTRWKGFSQRLESISRNEMQSVLEYLADDLLEGRAPGTRGGELSEKYLKSIFKLLDLEPGTASGYLQEFSLQEFRTGDILLTAGDLRLTYLEDLVGTFTRPESSFAVSAPLVYAGFGIHAPRWRWDDFKDVDVSGKILVTRVNDPGFFNPDIFEGTTLTYYGRWTCHIEEAIRRGAVGILLIHTDETAGYDWNVVVNSWTNGEYFIPSEIDNQLVFRGWIRERSFTRLLEITGKKRADLYLRSLSTDFRPVDLGMSVTISGRNQTRKVMNRNVVAKIPGQTDRQIVLSSHFDHFGVGSGSGTDRIFNGAIDNASAVSALIQTARILREYRDSLYYTITLLGCNSEEAGLLGSKYFVQTADREKIVANINFESTPVWKPSRSLMGIGARFSSFEDIIRRVAGDMNCDYSSFSMANQGLFYRSDQFPFARMGIPAVWISAGEDEVDGATRYTRFWKTDYHTVNDEYDPQWELGGMRQTVQAVLRVIRYINDSRQEPSWKDNLTFPILD